MINFYKYSSNEYIQLVAGNFIILFVQQFLILLVPIIIYDHTQSYTAMSLLKIIEFLPYITVSIFAGIFIDKFGWCAATHLALNLLLAAMIFLFVICNYLPFSILLMAVLVFISVGFCLLYNQARVVAIKDLITTEYIESANATLQVSMQISQIVVPIVISLLLIIATSSIALGLCPILVLGGIVFAGNKRKITYVASNKSTSLNEALRFVFNEWNLLLYSLIALLINACESVTILNAIYCFKSVYHISNLSIAIIYTLVAIIAIISSKLFIKFGIKISKKSIFLLSFLCSGLAYLMSLVYDNFMMIILILVVNAITFSVLAIHIWSYRHHFTPANLLGKVTSITSFIFKLGTILVLPASIWLAEVFGYQANFIICMMLCFFAVILSYFLSESSPKNSMILENVKDNVKSLSQ